MQRRHHAWILPLRVNPNARTRVLCFPHAGGGTATYRSWAPLAAELEVWAVALPGREHRLGEPATSSVSEMVARIADGCLDELGAALPVVLFGHSMGALLAFEVARELRRRGASGPLRHLFVSGCAAPDRLEPLSIHALPEPEFRRALRELGGTPEAVLAHEELMALVGPTLRADFRALSEHRFVAEPPLELPIDALAGLDDRRASLEAMHGWRRHTTGPFEAHAFSGGHFFLDAAREAVLTLLRRAL